jgi:hypothetical protein
MEGNIDVRDNSMSELYIFITEIENGLEDKEKRLKELEIKFKKEKGKK